uniref:Uncharacterized protein n=1 Tax=Romanomermis culicivorax TaxID=13658 RepID=A0A915HTT5_ROMCU
MQREPKNRAPARLSIFDEQTVVRQLSLMQLFMRFSVPMTPESPDNGGKNFLTTTASPSYASYQHRILQQSQGFSAFSSSSQ